MTDPTPPLDDDLSALLDHQADPQVATMVEGDRAATARLAELRRARDAVSATVVTPLDDDVVDRLVATALDAAADEVDPSTPDAHQSGAHVTPLNGGRTTRRHPPTWLVAAVVVAFVAIGLGLVWSGTRDTGQIKFDAIGASINGEARDQSAADSAERSAAPQSEASKGDLPTSTLGAASDAGTITPAPDVLIDLGTFPTTDELRVALKDAFPASPSLSPAASTSFDSTTGHRCSDQAKALFALDTDPSARGAAVVDGKRVVVFEFAFTTDDGRATTLIVATTTDSCQPVLTFQR